MLPGLFSAALLAGGAQALTFVTSVVASTQNITISASAAIGDLAVLVDYAANDGGATAQPTVVTPTGWTQIGSGITGGDGVTGKASGNVSYKLLISGDPNTAITGMTASTRIEKVMFIFRPAKGIATVTPNTWTGEVTNGNPGAHNVSASGGTAPLVVIGAVAASGTPVSYETESPSFTSSVLTADTRMKAGYTIYNSSPADQTFDFADNGNGNFIVSGYIAVT